MKIDKHVYDRIEKAFGNVKLPIFVCAPSGEQLFPEKGSKRGELLLASWDHDRFSSPSAEYVRLPGAEGLVLGCPGDTANAEGLLQLAACLLGTLMESENEDEVLRKVLLDGLSDTELETLAMERGLEMQKERCAVLFQCSGEISGQVSAMLREAFPDGGGNDLVTSISCNSVVLLRSMEDGQYEELRELVQALMDTVVEETGTSVQVGIGESKESLSLMSQSLAEARSAIEIGRKFRPENSIFSYRELLMERFICEVPEEMARKYYEVLFNKKTGRLFNEEMIGTIDKFFDCHLNVSEAARQLYIHRNTLVYRLDKVQRATGLDLRAFDDAITFKLLRMLGRTKDRQK